MHFSDGEGHSTYTIDASSDASANMGKPIHSLCEAGYLQLVLSNHTLPVGTEIEESEVRLVVNNQITLNFKVPAQRAEIEIPTDGVAIFARDIRDGLAPLTTPPSSTPDKGASPP